MPISRPKATKELQERARKEPEHLEMLATIGKLSADRTRHRDQGEARSAILVATGVLEHALAVAIASRLALTTKGMKQKIFDGDHEREGVIGTLFTRNLMAHALDIYGEKTFGDINAVRVVRNICAHSVDEIDFTSEAMRGLCNFHALEDIASAFDEPRVIAELPLQRIMEFMLMIVPYLILHGSPDWVPENKAQWRQTFA